MRRGYRLVQAIAGRLPQAPWLDALRMALLRPYLASCGAGCNVFPDTYLYHPEHIALGNNVNINRFTMIVAFEPVTVGADVLIGPYVLIHTGDHRFADPHRPIRTQGHDVGPITIEDDVWIAAHVVVTRGVRIGRGAVVGAGSVVTHDVEPYTIVAGAPARVIGRRGET